jgi:hypothetical protein
MEQKTSILNISSHHFIQRIESDLIKLTQTISAEHQIKPDPDAKNIARRMVQLRLNQLLNDEEIEGIRLLKKGIKDALLNAGVESPIARASYEVIKMMGLDDV